MKVFVDGRWVPEEQAVVSVFDRGFLYGDGVFETLRVHHGQPFRWRQHLERLQRGAEHPNLVMTMHPAPPVEARPPEWRVVLATPRLPAADGLARFKTCNKLAQILARAEADAAQAQEALLLNTEGRVVEAASGNLFWIEEGVVRTPPVASGILPGVTREAVRELCLSRKQPFKEASPRVSDLVHAQGVFLSLSSLGIVEVVSLDGKRLNRSPKVAVLSQAYVRILEEETGTGPATRAHQQQAAIGGRTANPPR